ncbi:MAG: organic solvent tolerance protein [Bdellovibrionales bacterium]|nr:organic solvent tolerance protein [Bdellovibrionales bacterium]
MLHFQKISRTFVRTAFVAIVLTVTTAILQPQAADAKMLTNRLGIGYRNQFSVDIPSIAANYYSSPEFALGAALGLQSGDVNSSFGLLFRAHRVIFPEENLNFYMGASAGLISTKIAATSNSGFELTGFAGAEFFMPGLDSLAINVEFGVGIVSTTAGVIFRTIGDSPLRAGMIFYF